MKQVVFRYGILAALAILALGVIQFFIVMPNASYETSEVVGYLTMVLSMVFVFMGIRHYRDRVNQGSLTFGQGLKIGVLIVLVPSVAFGLFDILYTEVIDPDWSDKYIKHFEDKIRASETAAVAATKIEKLHNQMEMFGNPAFQFLLMAATVFVIGLIASIISSLALMRKKRVSSSNQLNPQL